MISLDEAADLSRTGDIWIFRGTSGADRAIRGLTNAPINHVGMAVVLDDLPPLMWHAELGRALLDVWSGTHQRGVQLHDLREAVLQWGHRYGQRGWLRQLEGPVDRETEDAVLRTIARLDGTPFPSTARLATRWLRGRFPSMPTLPALPPLRSLPQLRSLPAVLRRHSAGAGGTPGSVEHGHSDGSPSPATGAGATPTGGVPVGGVPVGSVPVGSVPADGVPADGGGATGSWGAATEPATLETAYCAEVVALTYEAMGLLPARRPNWYDPGRFWSGDDLQLRAGFALGGEIAVTLPPEPHRPDTAS